MGEEKKHILVAEDEIPMAKALMLKLERAGFVVEGAVDGEEVLEKIRRSSFDLILLDLMMPKKDGFAVLEEMQSKGLTIPVIIASNLSQREDIDRVKSLGAKDYFVKSSTSLSEIVEKVTRFFNV